MSKLRVYQLASEYDVPSKEFVDILNKHNIPVKNHMSVLTEQQVTDFRKEYKKGEDSKVQPKAAPKAAAPKQEAKAQKPQQPKQESKPQPKAQPQSKPQHQERKPQQSKPQQQERKPQQRDNNASQNRRPADGQKNGNNGQSPQKRNAGGQGNNSSNNNNRPNNAKGQTVPNNSKPDRKNKNQKRNNNNNNQPAKVRDHSKKGKTARSVYKKMKDEKKTEKMKNQVFEIPELVSVGELAEILDVGATEIIKILMMSGTMATINQQIDYETAEIVASELGYEVKAVKMEDVVTKILEEYDEEDTGNEVKRPPVVTVMGHVDHGKTSLLDRIRKANVTAGEAGGITQHIGAYTVTINGESITFIDTPGHEAFTAMRSRGAQMTDIAILVVAADDGVMPQTVEAINHAKAAGVPIIVAINKIDKEGANPERVKQELTEHNLVVEEWGGDVIAVPVSAKKGENIDTLLEMVLLVSEMGELTADPKRAARGSVIEAQVKKGKGATASLLVQQGTLHVGDSIISGMTYGKVRTMIDDKGKRIKKAGPSTPVEISGLSDIPVAGDDFIVLENEKEARQLAEKRREMEKDARQAKMRLSLDDLFTKIQEGQIQDINIIIKADVQGSIEAIKQSLEKLNTDDVRINVIHGAVGAVNETDVMLASTSNAIIIGFNVRPDKNALAAAETEEVDIRLYRVIYDAIEDVKKAMEGMLAPEFVEKVTGNAEVREVFKIPNGSMIAGSYVTDGKISRNDEVRIIRDGIVVFEGEIASLRRFKDDVKEVASGYECGIGIDKYNDIKLGDVIETFVMEAVAREL
ncbi:translation initiation factor IF-2 [Eubacterium limosum]|uniref:Translation initiation factor IF-2 n=1 Tax=Eubacterium limosum TaxID=1736 RepID=A0ABT5UM31_EUBLI|nr:translation initiation factor IF-2 [Eubacterium limosum]MCB6568244.1 translation initiation factor IF-2 [Eubacterium limosum]MDE1469969.1 translation initiation factor IF-2 [Eubacterium limosum]